MVEVFFFSFPSCNGEPENGGPCPPYQLLSLDGLKIEEICFAPVFSTENRKQKTVLTPWW
jgi:hypothetical protein